MAEQPEEKIQQQGEQEHGGNGKVKADVFPFDTDITRQAANPVQLVTKKVNDQPDDDHQYAYENNIFADALTHRCKLGNANDMGNVNQNDETPSTRINRTEKQ